MKLSAWVSVGDLIEQKKTFFEKFFIAKFIYQSVFKKKNPKEILSSLKKCGVNGIELLLSSYTSNSDLDKISEIVKGLEMRIFSIHQSLSSLLTISIKEVDKICRIAKKMQAEVVVLHINVIGKQIFNKIYTDNLKYLEKQYALKIGIENSPKSVLSIFKPYSYQQDKFSKLIRENGLNITFDTTHLAQAGYDIIDFYKNDKDRIVNVHLSDYKKHFLNTRLLLTNNTHLPIGKGNLLIKEFLKTLKEGNYRGLITMEINGSLQDLCQSAEFIKSV